MVSNGNTSLRSGDCNRVSFQVELVTLSTWGADDSGQTPELFAPGIALVVGGSGGVGRAIALALAEWQWPLPREAMKYPLRGGRADSCPRKKSPGGSLDSLL